jgi:diguanylate cyclase (GGDEF)-like protein
MLGKELVRAQRENLSIAVLMADVDHFKLVNDTHGHLVGDAVLQGIAQRVGELTRAYDFAGRYGGEEFVIALPGCSLEDAVKRAEEFRIAIANTPVLTISGPLQVTCSFGVAIFFNNTPVEELIHRADEALYYAKRSGRNRVHACPQTPLSRLEESESLTPA